MDVRYTRETRRHGARESLIAMLVGLVVALTVGAVPAAAASYCVWGDKICVVPDDFVRENASGTITSAPTSAPSWEDRIHLRVEPGAVATDSVQFRLQTWSNITWEKGIDVEAWTGLSSCTVGHCRRINQTIRQVRTKDSVHGPADITIPRWELDMFPYSPSPIALVLGKAKMWGIYTGVYELSVNSLPLWGQGGVRYTFIWTCDWAWATPCRDGSPDGGRPVVP